MEQYKDYLEEIKYLENINKHFEFIVCDIWDRKKLFIEYVNDFVDVGDYIKRFEILYVLIKDFLEKIESGKLKDFGKIIFNIDYVFNLYEVALSFSYYNCLIRRSHGVKSEFTRSFKDRYPDLNDDTKKYLYERNIKYLELLLSKLRFEDNQKINNYYFLNKKDYI